MDDAVVVDDVRPLVMVGRSAPAQREQPRRTEKALEPVVVEAHAQTMADEPRGDRVEHLAQRVPGAMDLGIADDGESAGGEQAAQVAIALLADTAKLVLATARMLLWHEPDPSREVAPRSESPRISDRGNQRSCQGLDRPRGSHQAACSSGWSGATR
jgi:hypothetical protein